MLRQYYLLLACSIFKHETFGILLTKVQFLPVSQKNCFSVFQKHNPTGMWQSILFSKHTGKGRRRGGQRICTRQH